MHINYAASLGFDFCLERGSRKKKKKKAKIHHARNRTILSSKNPKYSS